MSDDKSKKDNRDRSRVAGNENYELAYLQEKLGVSREQIEEAIKAVGNNREQVEAYLSKSK